MNNAPLKTDFQKKQAEFSAYIRDPYNNPQPADVDAKRMQVYRELFFNNVESFLSSNFPVIRSILNNQQWTELCQDFFSRHSCKTPYFSEIPEEFIDFLQTKRNNTDDYPFLLELAHYEWVEMALSIAKEEPPLITEDFIDSLAEKSLNLSPLSWLLAYQFPVHKISPSYLPDCAPPHPTWLLVYRDDDDEVRFIELNAITFRLLQLIEESPAIDGQTCLQQLAQETPHINRKTIFQNGLTILQDMAQKGVITPASS